LLAFIIPIASWLITLPIPAWGITLLSAGTKLGGLTFLPLVLLLLFVAPYKVWKNDNNKLMDLITPRLEVEVESPEVEILPDGEVAYWWHLIVRNPTGTKISGCYCKLVSCRSQTKLNVEMPKRGIRYPWSTLGGSSLSRTTCNIGSSSFDVVDIAVCQPDEPNSFYTPILGIDQYKRYLKFPLPPGTYWLDIEVGSDDLDFQPTLRNIEFQFRGGFDLRIKDITDQLIPHSEDSVS
jgi:hypothetical protein